MSFKILKQERQKVDPVDDEEFIEFLYRDHLSRVTSPVGDLTLSSGSMYIPPPAEENKKDFDFFHDENKEAARKDIISDLESGNIYKDKKKSDDEVIDRRKSKRS